MNELRVGSPVRIVKRSIRYNPHIDNLDYIGIIDEIIPDGYNIQCITPFCSWGAVDADAVEYYYDPYIHASHPGLVK